jgi:hypothetical protein
MASAAFALAFNKAEPANPAIMYVTTAGFVAWLIPGMLAASVFVVSVAIGVLTTGAMPAWIGLTGLLCTAVLLAAIMFLPVMLLFAWTACVALVAIARSEKRLVTQPAPTPI